MTKSLRAIFIITASLVFVAPRVLAQRLKWDEYVTGMTLVGRPEGTCPPLVWVVLPNTPAATAGVKPGERVLAIDGHKNVNIIEAWPLLHTNDAHASTIELDGDDGVHQVRVDRIPASEIYKREGLKPGPDDSLFPVDATDAEMKRVMHLGPEPPVENKVFNVGHYPHDMSLYYPGFELFVWNQKRPITVGGIEDGPAKKAGVHYGDAVISVNGMNPHGRSIAELEKLFSSLSPSEMTLLIDRDGIHKTFKFRLEKASDVAAENKRQRYKGHMIPSVVPESFLHCFDPLH